MIHILIVMAIAFTCAFLATFCLGFVTAALLTTLAYRFAGPEDDEYTDEELDSLYAGSD